MGCIQSLFGPDDESPLINVSCNGGIYLLEIISAPSVSGVHGVTRSLKLLAVELFSMEFSGIYLVRSADGVVHACKPYDSFTACSFAHRRSKLNDQFGSERLKTTSSSIVKSTSTNSYHELPQKSHW
jgi:hypothetical protein